MVSARDALNGLQEAKGYDRFPDLPPNGDFIVQVKHNEIFQGRDGTIFLIVYTLLETVLTEKQDKLQPKFVGDHWPAPIVGREYSKRIIGIEPGNKYRDLKLGQVRSFMAAALNEQETNGELQEMAIYAAEQDVLAKKQCKLRVSTGAEKLSDAKQAFVPINFHAIG